MVFLLLCLICSLLLFLPPISSFFNGNYLDVFADQEYRSYSKIIICTPILFWFIDTRDKKENLIDITILAFFTLSVIFLYRYLILSEVREFDSRPLLKIRHGDPNFLSTFFTAAIPLSLYKYRIHRRKPEKFVYFILFMLFTVCTIITQSRMGMISLVLTVALSIYLFDWKINKFKLSGFLLLLVTGISVPFLNKIITRFANLADQSNLDRLKTYDAGKEIFFSSPWVGVGWNNSSEFFYQISGYPLFQSTTQSYEVHNTALKLLSELGIVGFGLFFFFFLKIVRTTHFTRKRNREIGTTGLVILIGLLANSFTIAAAYKDLFIYFMILIFILNSDVESEKLTASA